MIGEWMLLFAGLTAGFAGSWHCIGMCGPIVMTLPFQNQLRWKGIFNRMVYVVSKAFAYGGLGLLVAFFGSKINMLSGQKFLSTMLAVGIILMLIKNNHMFKFLKSPLLNATLGNVLKRLMKNPTTGGFVALGFLNGLLPCTMVWIALSASLTFIYPWQGFVFMFLFGLGTAPALLVLTFFSVNKFPRIKSKIRWWSNSMALLVAVLLIYRSYFDVHDHEWSWIASKVISLCK